jgi:hypothetical protein
MCMAFSRWYARNDAVEGVWQDKEAGIEPWSVPALWPRWLVSRSEAALLIRDQRSFFGVLR